MQVGGNNDNSNFKIPNPGTYSARLVWMVDYGTQEKWFGGKQTGHSHQGQWWFELVDTNEDFGKGVMEPFFVKTKKLTMGLKGTSNTLRDYLGILLQRPIVKTEIVDLKQFIGMPVILQIVHAKSQDGSKTYANIAGMMTPMAGATIAPLRNQPLFFDIGAMDMFTVFSAIPNKYVQATIVKSPEFQKFAQAAGFPWQQYVIADKANPVPQQPQQQFQQMPQQPQFQQQPQQFQQQPTAPVQPQFTNPVQTSAPTQPWVPPTPQWGQQAQQFANPQQFQQPTVPQPQFGQPQQQFQQPQAPQQPAVPATPQWNQPQQPQVPQFQQQTTQQPQMVPNPNYNPNVAGSPQFVTPNQYQEGDPF